MKNDHSYGGIETKTLSPLGIFSLWATLFTILPLGTYIAAPKFFISALIFVGVILLLILAVIMGVTFKWPGFDKL